MLSVIMLSVIMLSVIMLSVIMLSVIMLSVVLPLKAVARLDSYHIIVFQTTVIIQQHGDSLTSPLSPIFVYRINTHTLLFVIILFTMC